MTHHTTEYDDDHQLPRCTSHSGTEWYECDICGDDIHHERYALGYRLCMNCGNQAAISARQSWCVVQPYGKGPYMLVTDASAPQTLLDTNQKYPRS